MSHTRFVCVLLVACSAALAAPVPADPTPRDREGYPLPKGASARLGSLALRGDGVCGLSFSADGTVLFGASRNVLSVWDAKTGRARPSVKLETNGTTDESHHLQSVSEGGRVIVFATPPEDGLDGDAIPDAGFVFSFDCATGRQLGRVRCAPERFSQNCVSPDGRYFVIYSRSRKTVDVYDAGTCKWLRSITGNALNECAFADDNRSLLVSRDGDVRRIDVTTGKEVALGGTKNARLVRVSADGKRAATASHSYANGPDEGLIGDRFLELRDATTGRVTGRVDVGAEIETFAFLGSDALAVLSFRDRGPNVLSEYQLERWSARTLKREWAVPLPNDSTVAGVIDRLTVAPDGKRLVVRQGLVARAFDATTGRQLFEPVAHPSAIRWIGWSADGRTVRTACRNEIATWDLTGRRLERFAPRELTDGILPAFVDGNALVWASRSAARELASAALRPLLSANPLVRGAPADHEAWELVGWDFARCAVGWRVPLGAEPALVVLSRDGVRGAVVAEHQKKKEWVVTAFDGATGTARAAGAIGIEGAREMRCWPGVSLAPDARALVAAQDRVRAIDLGTGKALPVAGTGPGRSPYGAHFDRGGFLPAFAVSANGARTAAVAARTNGDTLLGFRFVVSDTKTGEALLTEELSRDEGYSCKVALDRTGDRVAVWSGIGHVRVYRAGANEKPQTFTLPGGYTTCAAFSPDGAQLAVGYADGTALIWDVTAKPKE